MSNPNRLENAGPVDPANGFPLWFGDGTTRLEIVLGQDLNAPAIGELPDPNAPMSFPDNFPDEAFYYMAETRLTVGGAGIAGRARVLMALEAAFGGAGEPAPGANVVFARIRVRMDDLVPGAKYSVYHPYGEFIDLEADDRGRVFHTVDLGIAEGDVFAVLETGEVAPFLHGTTAVPAGYLGDGITEQQVTGGPFRNHVLITGPGIREEGGAPDPANPTSMDAVFSDLFTVQGKIATRFGAIPTDANYEVSGGQTRLRVSATSDPGQDIRLVGNQFHFKLDGNGEHYSVIGDVGSVPDGGILVNLTDNPPTSAALPIGDAGTVADLVTIASATHDSGSDTLSVDVRSSDPAATLMLEPLSLPLSHGMNNLAGIAIAPGVIDVISDKGGWDTAIVSISGASSPQQPVEAKIGVTSGTFADEPVVLDGTGSPGATGYGWTQSSGPAATIASPSADVTDVQLSAAGTYVFTLTVTGSGGPATANVSITVVAPPATDSLRIDLCEYRTRRQQFRIVGNVAVVPNSVTVSRGGSELGTATVDATGDFAIRVSLAETAGAPPLPGETLVITSKRSTTTFPISIRN